MTQFWSDIKFGVSLIFIPSATGDNSYLTGEHINSYKAVLFLFMREWLTFEQLNTEDAEDEPEDKTDEQDVDDGGNGKHERIHYNL